MFIFFHLKMPRAPAVCIASNTLATRIAICSTILTKIRIGSFVDHNLGKSNANFRISKCDLIVCSASVRFTKRINIVGYILSNNYSVKTSVKFH